MRLRFSYPAVGSWCSVYCSSNTAATWEMRWRQWNGPTSIPFPFPPSACLLSSVVHLRYDHRTISLCGPSSERIYSEPGHYPHTSSSRIHLPALTSQISLQIHWLTYTTKPRRTSKSAPLFSQRVNTWEISIVRSLVQVSLNTLETYSRMVEELLKHRCLWQHNSVVGTLNSASLVVNVSTATSLRNMSAAITW